MRGAGKLSARQLESKWGAATVTGVMANRIITRKARDDAAFAAERLRQRLGRALRVPARLGFVLGSGFQGVTTAMRGARRIPYTELPGFPPVGVSGHAGELLAGELGGTPVLVLSGRAHYYEGYAMEAVTFAVRVLARCGVTDLLLTNAAGGVNRKFAPGDFMALTDHINFMGTNPLRGPVVEGRPRFVDLTRTYDPALTALLRRAAKSAGVRLHEGVYAAVGGPTYETSAEVRALARLGADAVGMSTVPEAIVARQCAVRVAAVACITNRAAGRSKQPLSHAEVLKVAARVGERATVFLETFASLYGKKA